MHLLLACIVAGLGGQLDPENGTLAAQPAAVPSEQHGIPLNVVALLPALEACLQHGLNIGRQDCVYYRRLVLALDVRLRRRLAVVVSLGAVCLFSFLGTAFQLGDRIGYPLLPCDRSP